MVYEKSDDGRGEADRGPEGAPAAAGAKTGGLARYLPELSRSGLAWVVAAFLALMAINAATLAVGRSAALDALNTNPVGALFAPFVFDSWGTIGGLGGVVLLFGSVLFGTPVARRRELSLFFIVGSIGIGEVAIVLWDAFFDDTGFYGSGSSAIAITAQGIVCALAAFGLLRLARQDTRRLGPLSSHWWYSFAIIDSTLILTSLWFVLVLEPIFVPTLLYNWRAHELGFFLGAAATVVYAVCRWSDLGLDGVVRIDEMVMNFRFDDLCGRFPRRLPKYHVVFGGPPGSAQLRPELGEIRVGDDLRGRDYREAGPEFERTLLRAMVQAELLEEGRDPGRPGDAEGRETRFRELAAEVGADPAP
ncbi:MAG: hypothetical protein ABSF83_13010 [Nitrososphaerales archaeon]|jgi:hypothetical protein